MPAKLKKTGSKEIATDIQIAAGMVTLALFSNPKGQGDQQQGAPQQQQAAPQGQPQQGGPPPQGGGQGQQLPPGLQAIAQVLQGANDPAKALANVIFMAISKVETQLTQRGIQIDDKVWIMGGGVLDRVLFEVMMALGTILHYPHAHDPNFTHQVKSDTLDLMDDSDQNQESVKVLHAKGLPIPKPPTGPDTGQQGLLAPQNGGQ